MPIRPYNSLQQILSSGGSVALGLAYAYKWSKDKISGLFARKFEPMLPDDKSQLIQIAMQGARAASEINKIPASEQIDTNLIPTNPFLFGDEPGGARVLYVVENAIDDGNRTLQIRLREEDFKTPEELLFDSDIGEWETDTDKYNKLVEMYGDKMANEYFRVLYTEKRF